mmetsp:Transcript_11329/g.26088  ORF Transcript_11329/g.26088 Transcript_11329/m.26088 type:complete len:549 (-) Transcript_11329:131-1777(-)
MSLPVAHRLRQKPRAKASSWITNLLVCAAAGLVLRRACQGLTRQCFTSVSPSSTSHARSWSYRAGAGSLRGSILSRHAVSDLSGISTDYEFASQAAWEDHLATIGALPPGFRVGVTTFDFNPVEMPGATGTMRVSVILLDKPTKAWAAVFTRNKCPGSPVVVGRALLSARSPLQAVVINNKVSNVATGPAGVEAAKRVCSAVASSLGLEAGADCVLPSSTGIIGWRIPVQEMTSSVGAPLAAQRAAGSEAAEHDTQNALPLAKAIMTTDRYAKVARADLGAGKGSIVGVAKGAGMVEPNLATMLVFITTDARVEGGQEAMQRCLKRAVAGTFNAISVDGDESTSDTVVLLSSELAEETSSEEEFTEALSEVTAELASHVVRNGEGTNHVIRCAVTGAPSFEAARAVGQAVTNGQLVKCAVAGEDPNVGRIVGKIGQHLGQREAAGDTDAAVMDLNLCEVKVGGISIFQDGRSTIDGSQEADLQAHMGKARLDAMENNAPDKELGLPYPPHGRCVEIEVHFRNAGKSGAVVLGSDLTHGYVTENADYRS